MLAAPDVDSTFRIADRRHGQATAALYTSSRATTVHRRSRRVWGCLPVGAIDPERAHKEGWRRMGSPSSTSPKSGGDNLHHTSLGVPEIVRLIGAACPRPDLDRQSPGTRRPYRRCDRRGRPYRRNAAGLVVAAPAAIVDQNTRRNYVHHVGHSPSHPAQRDETRPTLRAGGPGGPCTATSSPARRLRSLSMDGPRFAGSD